MFTHVIILGLHLIFEIKKYKAEVWEEILEKYFCQIQTI